MISVEEALKLVLETSQSYGNEIVSLSEAIGRILAEDVMADRPMPPFDRVTMDGIAILFESFADESTAFKIENIGSAGSPQLTLKDSSKCIEIMTGASLPKGTDTVVRYEDLEMLDGAYYIQSAVRKGQNIHVEGSDHSENEILLKKGTEIKAVDINILATVGKSEIYVLKMPEVAVISSGDELVDVDQIPAAYQIRKSNVHMVSSRLKQLGVPSQNYHIIDDSEEIIMEIQQLLDEYDVLLMSGGVSKGKFDLIPEVLDELGFKKLFHKVAQRPGKPFWFGSLDEKIVFAFPGNPVSTLACFQKYFIPWLEKSLGQIHIPMKVVLEADVSFKPDLTYFAQAYLQQKDDGRYYARVQHGNGSGDVVNPSLMCGFIELPDGKELYQAGELYNFMPFYPLYK